MNVESQSDADKLSPRRDYEIDSSQRQELLEARMSKLNEEWRAAEVEEAKQRNNNRLAAGKMGQISM